MPGGGGLADRATAAELAGAAVLVVPCEEPVPGSPGRIERESLVGLTADGLRQVFAQIRGSRVG